MIIEFSGIPASGKSTIISKLKEEKIDVNFNIFKTNNIFFIDFLLLLNIFKLKKIDLEIIKKAYRIIKRSNNSFFHKINILRNVIKKFIIYRLVSQSKKKYIIDEGVYHIPFILFVDITQNIDSKLVINFIQLLKRSYENIQLFIIDSKDEELFNRVVRRGKEGHRRIDFSKEKNIKRFMEQSREVLEILKKETNAIVYKNEGDINLEKIKAMLGIQNV